MNRTRWAGLAMIGAILMLATGCPTIPFGDPGPPPPTVQPIVTVGGHHSCAQNGRIYCWGDNSAGQLGNGTTTASSTPVEVTGITWADSLSAGADRTCAVAGWDHNVWCWGDNSNGGLGDGTTTDRSTPTKVVGLIDMRIVSVGDTFTCATRRAGGVVCWGQVPGLPGLTTTPVPIAGLDAALSVSVGARHACALNGSALECFGDNSVGQLGDGTTTSSATPVAVLGVPGLGFYPNGSQEFAAGGDHTCAANWSSATYWCWGDNSSGQLGDGTTTNRPTPVAVPFPTLGYALRDATLSLGEDSSCIVFTETAADATPAVAPYFGCWGDNSSGQLGDGTTTSRMTFQPGSMAVQPGLVAAGDDHSCGLQYATATSSKPRIRCWGGSSSGQLGDGTTTSSPTPVEVLGAYSKDPPAVKPLYSLPKVTFTATPKIVVAGQPVTFTLHITSGAGLISTSTAIEVDESAALPHFWGCDDDHAVWTGADTDRTATFSCTMPADAPVRIIDAGQPSLWAFSVDIRAYDSPAYHNWFEFYLKGTSTDSDGPTDVGSTGPSVTPNPVIPGQPFVVTRNFSEPHGPITASPISFSNGSCGLPVIDASAAPLYTVSATCVADGATPPGTEIGLNITTADAFGFMGYSGWDAQVAGP